MSLFTQMCGFYGKSLFLAKHVEFYEKHYFTLKSAQAVILGEMYTFAWQVTSNTYDIPKGILMIPQPGVEMCFRA